MTSLGRQSVVVLIVAALTVAAFIAITVLTPRVCRLSTPEICAADCYAHLKALAAAIESYELRHGKMAPRQLQMLVPEYLPEIPECPASQRNSYPCGYTASGSRWTIMCSGEHHADAGVPPGYPRASSLDGVSLRP